jgi:NADP-dependent 3-hydroxy acid dehydrogenase YdfG
MDIALVTGAASGLGLAIARKLVLSGYRVYGLGGNYSSCPFKHSEFMPITCNMADLDAVQEKVNELLEKEQNIHVLVNNAKVYSSKNFDELSPADLETILKVNLYCPMLLMRLALPGLREYHGYIINIGPTSPDLARGGPAGAAAAGGLHWMSQSLFDQYRETGVKVTTIFPQGNRWRPDEVPAPMTENSQSIIDPEAVADAVEQVVDSKNGNIVTEIVIRPKRITEQPTQPVFYVPYPKPKPLPPMPTRASHAPLDLDIQAERKRYKQQIIEEAAQEILESGDEPEDDSTENKKESRNKRRNRRRKERRNELKKTQDDNQSKDDSKKEEIKISENESSDKDLEAPENQQIPRKKSRRNRRKTSKFSEKLDVNKVANTPTAKKTVDQSDHKIGGDKQTEEQKNEVSEGESKNSRNRRRRRRGNRSNAPKTDDNKTVEDSSAKTVEKPIEAKSEQKKNESSTVEKTQEKADSVSQKPEPEKTPKRKQATKKATTKKVAKKKVYKPAETRREAAPKEESVVKKSATKKTTAKKKTATKKAAKKKTATKKATTKKIATKKAAVKKSATKKTTVKKKTATKKATAKKAATKKVVKE